MIKREKIKCIPKFVFLQKVNQNIANYAVQ